MRSLQLNPKAGPDIRRRTYYVDRSIQRSLLIAMVTLEVLLVAASTWAAYWYLSGMIDDNLYRVHLARSGSILAQLAQKGFAALGAFACINMLALLIAARIWSGHENHILREFADLIGKTRLLDFSPDCELHAQHEVLSLAAAWRARERIRFGAIREHVTTLENAVGKADPGLEIRAALQGLSALLR